MDDFIYRDKRSQFYVIFSEPGSRSANSKIFSLGGMWEMDSSITDWARSVLFLSTSFEFRLKIRIQGMKSNDIGFREL